MAMPLGLGVSPSLLLFLCCVLCYGRSVGISPQTGSSPMREREERERFWLVVHMGVHAKYSSDVGSTSLNYLVGRFMDSEMLHSIRRQMTAARSAPMRGATQNSQSWFRAVPPTMRAGPKLLAGLTEVPVIGMPTRCIRTKLSPIDMPAKPFGAFSPVEP